MAAVINSPALLRNILIGLLGLCAGVIVLLVSMIIGSPAEPKHQQVAISPQMPAKPVVASRAETEGFSPASVPVVVATNTEEAPAQPAVEAQEQAPELATPLFYTIHTNSLEKLDMEQQVAVSQLQQDYINFYNEWSRSGANDMATWNAKMDDYRQRVIAQIGPDAADSLFR